MSRQTDLVKNNAPSLAQAGERPTLTPACDVYENQEEILVIADVPGIAADALQIHLDKGELTLEARHEHPAQEGSSLVTEWTGCDFRRRFAIPGGVDASKISAKLKDGVMFLHLPKSEALKPRKIAVRAG